MEQTVQKSKEQDSNEQDVITIISDEQFQVPFVWGIHNIHNVTTKLYLVKLYN